MLNINTKNGNEIIALCENNGCYNALLFNESRKQYIVAWCYNIEADVWGQGHYFDSYFCGLEEAKENAKEFFKENYMW